MQQSDFLSEQLLVQKSLPLIELWQSDLTLQEFKILDLYLAKIDNHKPENKTVTFSKGALEKALGVNRIHQEALDKYLKVLSSPILIKGIGDGKNTYNTITLFENTSIKKDLYGVIEIELTASPKAMQYFFNIENIGCIKYRLKNILSLKSRYSYILYAYLQHNSFLKSWTISLEDLKIMLNCHSVEAYSEFFRFNAKVLKPVQEELAKKTDCIFDYESVKRGRTVVGIKFTV